MKKLILLAIAGVTFSLSAQKPYLYITEQWNGTSWDSVSKSTYTYNPQFFTLANDMLDFVNPGWQNNTHNTFSNNAAGDPTVSLSQAWDAVNSIWTNNRRTTTSYTASAKPAIILDEQWNGSAYDNSQRQTYTYDSNVFQSGLLMENWNGSSWDNSVKMSFTTDANGSLTHLMEQQWDGTAWQDLLRGVFTYSVNKPLSSTFEYFDGTSWSYIFRLTDTYDANLSLTSELFENWGGSAWENMQVTTYTYDAYNNYTLSLTQNWDTQSTSYVPSQRTTAFYLATLPAVQTLTVSDVTHLSAVVDATVLATGGTAVSRGICYNTSPAPTVSNTNVAAGTGAGAYSATLTGLGTNVTYYARAYVTNSVGTVYGDEISFTTLLDVGLTPTKRGQVFKVYPQPATDVVFIQSNEHVLMKVCDASGKRVLDVNVSPGIIQVDISKLPAGVYFIGETGRGIKFIKQ